MLDALSNDHSDEYYQQLVNASKMIYVSKTASNLGHRTDRKQGIKFEMNRSSSSPYVPSLLKVFLLLSVVHH